VFAFFGSRGLFAYDLEGTLLWQKDFGVRMRMDMAFGEGTALTLHDNRLLLHFDHLDTGFLVMLDPATGREIWRAKRTERFNWAAPYVATHNGRRQIVMSGETVRGYDFGSGELLWAAEGLGENTIPQPVQHGDLVFAMSRHTIRMLMAIRLGRRGELTNTDAIAWSTPRGVSYTPSPLLHDGRLYVLSDNGLLSAFDAATGKPLYHRRGCRSRTASRRPRSAPMAGCISPPRTRTSSSASAIGWRCWPPTRCKGSHLSPRRSSLMAISTCGVRPTCSR